jgi:dTDP-4-amino-4,6-dideoxygalactose transaminase
MTSIPVARPFFGPEETQAVADTLASGWVAQGPRVAAFETGFARRVGADHAVATSSCTSALHLALLALHVGPGDEVIVPSLSFIATANSVMYMNATPIFADVDEDTQNLTAATIEAVTTPLTRAVIVVHQAGVPADMLEIHAFCDGRGIAVVEDAACAIGSTLYGEMVGSHSDLVAFSFHPRKVMTTGEGGMVTTRSGEWAGRMRQLREHAMNVSAANREASRSPVIEHYLEVGFNYRMTDLQAAVGIVQLTRLDALIARRRQLAARYQAELASIPGLRCVTDPPYGTTNYQSFWIVLPDEFPISRNDLLQVLMDNEIGARRGIMAAHLEPAYADHARRPLPVTERLTGQSLVIPLFHEMSDSEQDRVVTVLRRVGGDAGSALASVPSSAGVRRTDLAPPAEGSPAIEPGS